MADVILVLNAGSSSLKYCAYDTHGDALDLILRGRIDGLYTSPAFRAIDTSDTEVEARQWDDGTELGHSGAIEFLADFLHGHGEGHTLVAVGHRVVHGGIRFTEPVKVTGEVLAELQTLNPLAPPCTSHITSSRSASLPSGGRNCPRWPVSTRPSTAHNRRPPRPLHSRTR